MFHCRVMNQGEYLIDCLVLLYEELYFSPRVVTQYSCLLLFGFVSIFQVLDYDKKTVVSRLLRLSSKLSRDYGDYLAMKATINLPFPGYPYIYIYHFKGID